MQRSSGNDLLRETHRFVMTGMRDMGLEGGEWESGRIHRFNIQGPGHTIRM